MSQKEGSQMQPIFTVVNLLKLKYTDLNGRSILVTLLYMYILISQNKVLVMKTFVSKTLVQLTIDINISKILFPPWYLSGLKIYFI